MWPPDRAPSALYERLTHNYLTQNKQDLFDTLHSNTTANTHYTHLRSLPQLNSHSKVGVSLESARLLVKEPIGNACRHNRPPPQLHQPTTHSQYRPSVGCYSGYRRGLAACNFLYFIFYPLSTPPDMRALPSAPVSALLQVPNLRSPLSDTPTRPHTTMLRKAATVAVILLVCCGMAASAAVEPAEAAAATTHAHSGPLRHLLGLGKGLGLVLGGGGGSYASASAYAGSGYGYSRYGNRYYDPYPYDPYNNRP